jgi:hypothetical protein
MLERGIAVKQSHYDEEKKDFIDDGGYLIPLPGNRNLSIRYCPVCGTNIPTLKPKPGNMHIDSSMPD